MRSCASGMRLGCLPSEEGSIPFGRAMSLSSRGLGSLVLSQQTGVRLPVGTPQRWYRVSLRHEPGTS